MNKIKKRDNRLRLLLHNSSCFVCELHLLLLQSWGSYWLESENCLSRLAYARTSRINMSCSVYWSKCHRYFQCGLQEKDEMNSCCCIPNNWKRSHLMFLIAF